jgi:Uma2 family endonuclease
MPTMVLDPAPTEIEAFLERRRALGQDRRDEVWDGVYRIVPTPSGAHMDVQQQLAELLGPPARTAGLHPRIGGVNLGDADNYRVPDGVLQRERATRTWHATAALALEIRSPSDDTFKKLSFYADHGVDELLIVDLQQRSIDWLGLAGGEYHPIERSSLIDLGPAELAQRIDWPPTD